MTFQIEKLMKEDKLKENYQNYHNILEKSMNYFKTNKIDNHPY